MKHNSAQEKQEQDKISILEWFQKYAHGYRNARTRKDILPFILTYRGFPSLENKDRYFREIASELIKDGHIASSSTRGYWFIPLHTNNQREVQAVIACHVERKAKALSTIAECDKIINEYSERVGQKEFFGVR